MTNHAITVDPELAAFIEEDVLPGLPLEAAHVWRALDQLLATFTPRNVALLQKRERLQEELSAWHRAHKDAPLEMDAYKAFLKQSGYLVPEPDDFAITTANVDPEIASIAGPQLVVPIMNARFAINAANARWGSLYDALYGTDAIDQSGDLAPGADYNETRGAAVVAWGKAFLDDAVPLTGIHHADVTSYEILDGALVARTSTVDAELENQAQFVGYAGKASAPTAIVLRNNGLHIILQIDAAHPVGKTDPSGLCDIVLESAVTTIMDAEDSVAAVDAEDKVLCYRNWLGLMKGDLSETFEKGGKPVHRTLVKDQVYRAPDGSTFELPGRSLMLVRNVGHLMTNPAVLMAGGAEAPEGLLDAFFTSLIAMHDLQRAGGGNSRAGSVYIVKPKMHGPEEVAFANDVFDAVEDALGLARHTLKIGIMDEERRTSVNLKACIYAAKDRVIFINTGFLDRTGDEMHTAIEAGPMLRKGDMKTSTWISAYEDSNVDIGLATGLSGKAQIGKGMWAMPDEMAAMLDQKIGHPKAGASCAWAPSPTAATLHATHYHSVNVQDVQADLSSREAASLDDILTIPVVHRPNWSADDIQAELDNNAQGILGYVVRWVEQGIGCSKVPDINGIGLMEDRATLRISSQHIANWLHHGICSENQVMDTMKRMAKVVDGQNEVDPHYRPMAPEYDHSTAFKAACDLIFKGRIQPSGYTEPLLHEYRKAFKAKTDTPKGEAL
ncbi:MAG: malate synthase G [Pseudomonadota bacterium]